MSHQLDIPERETRNEQLTNLAGRRWSNRAHQYHQKSCTRTLLLPEYTTGRLPKLRNGNVLVFWTTGSWHFPHLPADNNSCYSRNRGKYYRLSSHARPYGVMSSWRRVLENTAGAAWAGPLDCTARSLVGSAKDLEMGYIITPRYTSILHSAIHHHRDIEISHIAPSVVGCPVSSFLNRPTGEDAQYWCGHCEASAKYSFSRQSRSVFVQLQAFHRSLPSLVCCFEGCMEE